MIDNMQINFIYNKDKDIWCLQNKGKSSTNSHRPTKQYEQLVSKFGENPTAEEVTAFVDQYITENGINIPKRIEDFQKDWENISTEFQKRTKTIFGTSLPHDMTVYLTINSRCPYSIEDNFFYASLESHSVRKTVMHELWHFYTWHGLGTNQEEKLGKQRYNDLKEALTVLLNTECKDLLPEGVIDAGYPQHQEIREEILQYWEKDKNIKNLWNNLVSLGRLKVN